MRKRIAKYRREPDSPHADPRIGCILLTQPFFFDEIDWIPVPADFSLNIVQGKTYGLASGVGRELWLRVQSILRTSAAQTVGEDQVEI